MYTCNIPKYTGMRHGAIGNNHVLSHPPRELAYNSSWYCTNEGTRTRCCNRTRMKERMRKNRMKQDTKRNKKFVLKAGSNKQKKQENRTKGVRGNKVSHLCCKAEPCHIWSFHMYTTTNCHRRSLMQLGVWPLEGVCHAPHSNPSSNEEQNSEGSDELSPSLMVACVQVPVRKFPERLSTAWICLVKLLFLPLCIRVCALSFVIRTPPKEYRFWPGWHLWRPVILPSIHLCPRPKPFWVRGTWF